MITQSSYLTPLKSFILLLYLPTLKTDGTVNRFTPLKYWIRVNICYGIHCDNSILAKVISIVKYENLKKPRLQQYIFFF